MHATMWSRLLWTLLGAGLGLFAVLIPAWSADEPPGTFPGERFAMERRPTDPVKVVRPGAPIDVGWVFADFDLSLDLNLEPGAEVGVVLRRVEPSSQGAQGRELFHGRFATLMLSTTDAGDAFATREQMLFGNADPLDPTGGVVVPASQPVELRVEGRGRELFASLRGERYGPFRALDDRGGIAIFSRFGDATVDRLEILHRVDPPDPLGAPIRPAAFGAFIGALVGALAGFSRSRPLRRSFLIVLPLGGLLVHEALLVYLLPDLRPLPESLWIGGLCSVPSVVLGLRAGWRGALLGVVLALPMLEVVTRLESRRLRPLEDARLDALFGPDSAQSPLDQLTGRLRSSRMVHQADPFQADPPARALVLGGRWLWEPSPDIATWHAWLAAESAGRREARPLEAVVDGRPFADPHQQWLLADRILLDLFQPEVVVFGVGPDVLETEDARPEVAEVEATGFAEAVPALDPTSLWLDLLRRASQEPISLVDEDRLVSDLRALGERAARDGFAVLVVLDESMPPGLRGALAEAARDNGLSVLRVDFGGDPQRLQDRLSDRIVAIRPDR